MVSVFLLRRWRRCGSGRPDTGLTALPAASPRMRETSAPRQPRPGGASGGGAVATMRDVARLAGVSIATVSFVVNDTKPVWIYCAQGNHCEKGMVLVINEK